jgi:hypothetical protein
MCISYFQPITRARLSAFFCKEISRELTGHLRGSGVIASGPRSPTPGAPYTYVTTKEFLLEFGLDTLRDLPDFQDRWGGSAQLESAARGTSNNAVRSTAAKRYAPRLAKRIMSVSNGGKPKLTSRADHKVDVVPAQRIGLSSLYDSGR